MQMQQQQQQAQQQQAQQQQLTAQQEKMREDLRGAAIYVRGLPADPQARKQGATAYLSTLGYDQGVMQHLDQTGLFNQLDDQTLDAFIHSGLGTAGYVDQQNNVRDFNQGVNEFERGAVRADALASNTIQDTGLDNARADRLADNTIENTQFDNQHATATLNQNAQQFGQTHGLNQQKFAETQANNAATQGFEAQRIAQTANKPAKAFADAQAKAATFGHRADASNAELAEIVASGFDPTNIDKRVFSSQKFRQYDRAKREFVNAVLRQESGAAIGKEEFKNADKQYFPQFGDDDSTIEAKRLARERAAEGLKRQSQGAYEALYGGQSVQAEQTNAPQPGTAEGGYVFQGGDPADPNNWKLQ